MTPHTPYHMCSTHSSNIPHKHSENIMCKLKVSCLGAVYTQVAISRAEGLVDPGTPAFTLGWGAQDDGDHTIPSSKLKHLNTYTIDCPEEFSGVWPSEAIGEKFPKFICIGAFPLIGGPCIGDQGGVLQNLFDLTCMNFVHRGGVGLGVVRVSRCDMYIANQVMTDCAFCRSSSPEREQICARRLCWSISTCEFHACEICSLHG